MNKISGYMLTLNEAHCVRASLTNLCELCDDVLVLDGGSTDGTIDILWEFTQKEPDKFRFQVQEQNCERLEAGWQEPKRRNWCRVECKYDHILALDADELFSPEMTKEAVSEMDGFVIPTYNLLNAEEYIVTVNVGTHNLYWFPDNHVRASDGRKYHYQDIPLHSQLVDSDGNLASTQLPIMECWPLYHFNGLLRKTRDWDNPSMRGNITTNKLPGPLPPLAKLMDFSKRV